MLRTLLVILQNHPPRIRHRGINRSLHRVRRNHPLIHPHENLRRETDKSPRNQQTVRRPGPVENLFQRPVSLQPRRHRQVQQKRIATSQSLPHHGKLLPVNLECHRIRRKHFFRHLPRHPFPHRGISDTSGLEKNLLLSQRIGHEKAFRQLEINTEQKRFPPGSRLIHARPDLVSSNHIHNPKNGQYPRPLT